MYHSGRPTTKSIKLPRFFNKEWYLVLYFKLWMPPAHLSRQPANSFQSTFVLVLLSPFFFFFFFSYPSGFRHHIASPPLAINNTIWPLLGHLLSSFLSKYSTRSVTPRDLLDAEMPRMVTEHNANHPSEMCLLTARIAFRNECSGHIQRKNKLFHLYVCVCVLCH